MSNSCKTILLDGFLPFISLRVLLAVKFKNLDVSQKKSLCRFVVFDKLSS